MSKIVALILFAILAVVCTTLALAQPILDPRFCGPAARDADGTISRSTKVINQFRFLHKCPSTGKYDGACPGWAVDHVIPLACGGCDAVGNMQWLPNAIKSAAGTLPKDRWERRVYCGQ